MTRNILDIPNPTDLTTYQKVRIERAADAGGVPGAFAELVVVDATLYSEKFQYIDTTGSATSWYRHRYANTALTVNGDYSPSIQFGDYLIRQWIKLDIPDADLGVGSVTVNDRWDKWRDQVIQDLSNEGLGRVAPPQDITPTDSKVELYGLNAEIRRAIQMDVYSKAGWHVGQYHNWKQWGRQVRIYHPRTTQTYKVWGVAELTCLPDIDDELYTTVKWGMRMYYVGWRRDQRLDMRPALSRTRLSDTTTNADFRALFADAESQFRSRVEKAKVHQAMSFGARG